LPLRLSEAEWRRLLRWFVLGHSAAVIAREARLDRKRVLRGLLVLRARMAAEVPAPFTGTVEVDETYLGSWRNKRRPERARGTKRGRGTSKQPVFGILCRGGKVWAELVPDVTAATLLPYVDERVAPGSVVWTDTMASFSGKYTGLATRGYVHRMINHQQRFSDRRGGHINGMEGFWGYLKRQLMAKGGIRRDRLPLYLAEYVWRYNHRRLSPPQKVSALLALLRI
jgi:transposase